MRSGDVILEEASEEIGLEIERIDYIDGIEIYLKGHTYPYKGLPSAEAIWATNIVKKLLFFAWIPKIRQTAIYVMKPYILSNHLQTPTTRSLANFLSHFTSKDLAQTIAHVFEYDAAYRFRIQSFACETDIQRIIRNPHKETRKLFVLAAQTEYYPRIQRTIKYLSLLSLLLLIPPIRSKFKIAVQGIEEMHPDEADKYWMSQKTDLWKNPQIL